MKRFIKRFISVFIVSFLTANAFVFSDSSDSGIIKAIRDKVLSSTSIFSEKEDDESSLTSEETSKINTITTTIGGSSGGKSDTKTINISTGTGSVTSSATGETQLRVSANVYGAAVYVDGSYKGTSPLTIKNISAGVHKVRVEARGYESYETMRTVQSGKTSVLNVTLARHKGVLVINSNQSNVKYYCDGQELYSSVNRIPEGNHQIKVRKFGYKDFESQVYIRAFSVKRLFVTLVEAPFEITQLTASCASFNPDYSDRLGQCTITGYVTNKGSGSIEISDSSGKVVSRKDFSQFTTWEQVFVWNGRDFNGTKLPDGFYTVKFSAEGKSVSLKTRIDYSIKYYLFDFGYGGLGFGTVPVAIPPKANTLYTGISINPSFNSSKQLVEFPVGLLLSFTQFDGFTYDFNVTGFCSREWQFDVDSEGIHTKIPSMFACSLKYSRTIADFNFFKMNIGISGGYGYSEAHTLAPYGIADGKGANVALMFGLDFSKLFLGFTSQAFFGATTGNLIAGDNTFKNAVTASFMPGLYFSINGWAALHSVTGVYHSAGIGASEGVSIINDPFRGIELGFDVSFMLPQTSIYLTAGELIYYYPFKKVYYNGFFGAKLIL